jgi:hypothetical protein
MVMLTDWSLWKEWNRRVFDGAILLPHQLYQVIVDEANAWIGGGFAALSALFTASPA